MSAAVFDIFDAAGNKVQSLGDELGLILGHVDINNSVNPTGSITDAQLADGMPWAYSRIGFFDGGTIITFSGTQMSWAPAKNGHGNIDTLWAGRVYYGIV